jgi:hypothetical protein
MSAEEHRQAHGRTGNLITEEGIETGALVYVAPELRLKPCEECGGRLKVVGRFNMAGGESVGAHVIAECQDCRIGYLIEV